MCNKEEKKRELIQYIEDKWPGVFSFEKLVYVNATTKVSITCKEHGDIEVLPFRILSPKYKGDGCKKCTKVRVGATLVTPWEKIEEDIWEVHGVGAFRLFKETYIRSSVPMTAECTKCDTRFYPTPINMVRGSGCPSCAGNLGITRERFIETSISLNEDHFDYKEVPRLFTKDTNIPLTCKVTDKKVFPRAADHMNGSSRCAACSKRRKKTDEDYQEDMLKRFGPGFNLKSKYPGNQGYVDVECPEGHTFNVKAGGFINDRVGCPECYKVSAVSNQERTLQKFISSIYKGAEFSVRGVLPGNKELDIYIPDRHLAIEYDGVYWHSEEKGKDSNYHLSKTVESEKLGIRLIHVFEDEWVGKTQIVKNRLSSILGVNRRVVYARKTEVKRITCIEASRFFEENHLQGSIPSESYYGLFEEGTLISCMSFGKPRFDKVRDSELLRYAASAGVVGGFSKLITTYLRDHPEVSTIISYSDKRWSQGNVYKSNGFKYLKTSEPDYSYFNGSGDKLSRYQAQEHNLKDILKEFNPELSEVENCRNNRYYRIWDCGMDVWVYEVNRGS